MLEKFKRPAVLIAVIAALVLALIVGLVVGVTRGQEPREPAQATATPLPQRTVDPCAFGNAAKLANAILDAERPYEALERKVTAALNAVTPISLPGQLAGELTQAVQGRRDIAPENGYYTLSGSSGGTYVYD
ncbi:MAG: hypothetical protein IJ240_11625, partial [Clostridia bacterium]|nr:hypothetical protein [Clostridia bacterium]